jgi:hypothetical protein
MLLLSILYQLVHCLFSLAAVLKPPMPSAITFPRNVTRFT